MQIITPIAYTEVRKPGSMRCNTGFCWDIILIIEDKPKKAKNGQMSVNAV